MNDQKDQSQSISEPDVQTKQVYSSSFSKYLPLVLVAVVAAFLASGSTYLVLKQSNTQPQNTTQNTTTLPPSATPIPNPTNTTPTVNITAGQTILSPVMIKGAVLNSWLFEGVFPIKLLDNNRKEIAQTLAKQVSGSWTEPGIVTFEAKLEFTTTAPSGYIVLMKDNPSGLPEKNIFFEIPVLFAQSFDETANWKTYSSNKFGFSVKHPNDPKVFLSQNKDNNGFILPSYNINFGVNTKEEYIQIMGKHFPTKFEDLDFPGNIPPLTNKKKITIDRIEALRADAVGKYEKDFNLDVVIFANGSAIYSFYLDLSAATSSNTLTRDEKVFDQILSTFKFTP